MFTGENSYWANYIFSISYRRKRTARGMRMDHILKSNDSDPIHHIRLGGYVANGIKSNDSDPIDLKLFDRDYKF